MYSYYGGQIGSAYFQSTAQTVLSTQLLTQTTFHLLNAHVAFQAAAGEVPVYASRARVLWLHALSLSLRDGSSPRPRPRPRHADAYNDTVAALEVPRGDCPAGLLDRLLLDDSSLREGWYKFMLRNAVEGAGRLDELVLSGVDMASIDRALDEKWNSELYCGFVGRWGSHRCGTPGGCALWVRRCS